MCGIAGAVGLVQRPEPALVASVRAAMEHRGPDRGADWWNGRDTWLGFQRLAILDVSEAADQPMVDEATGVALVFNGEIYNYVELRRELEAHGHSFRTSGDTEVVLRGWIEWGEGLFERCNGMWAVAIVDPKRAGVLLCRDRFGEKPLHYGRDRAGAWWFASEPASLRAADVGSGRIDRSRVAGLLLLGHLDDIERSWFDGISQVPPGHSVVLRSSGPSVPRRWWDLAGFVHERWGTGAVGAAEVADRLDDAVRLRLRSDVEVGTSLSGGVDSSAVVGSLRAVDPDRVLHAFTASFPGHDVDEWGRAERTAERHGITLHRVEPTVHGFVDDLDRLIRHQGAPIEAPTVYAQWCVMAAAAAQGVTVLLDGQGADESWGGYRKYVGTALVDAVFVDAVGRGDVGRGDVGRARAIRSAWSRYEGLPRPPAGQIAGLVGGVPGRRALAEIRRRTARGWLGGALEGVGPADPLGGASGRGVLLERAAVADLGSVVLPRLLRYCDRNSMAHSREVRLPFLDTGVLDAAFRSDWSAGFATGWTKAALRDAQRDRVSAEVLELRAKFAYQAPDELWLRDPRVADAVTEAGVHLRRIGLLGDRFPVMTAPWKVLSLSRLVDLHHLRP